MKTFVISLLSRTYLILERRLWLVIQKDTLHALVITGHAVSKSILLEALKCLDRWIRIPHYYDVDSAEFEVYI